MPQSDDFLDFAGGDPVPDERPPEPSRELIPSSAPIGRELPHSAEAEEHLLSCCMLDGADVVPRCEAAGIGSASFYDRRHATVFGCIIDLFRKGASTDVAVVAEHLKSTRQLEHVGGYPFLLEVTSRVPTTAQAGYFIEKVRELSVRRQIIRAATGAAEECYRFSGSLDDLVGSVRASLDHALNPSASRADWAIVPADRLCASGLKPPPELIKGMLYQGGTMILSGPSKAHKTYTMLAAAIAIASGRLWLGFETVQAPVLYLNLELQDFAAKSRLEAICEGMGIAPPAGLHMANLRGEMVSLDRLSARVGIAIKQTRALLVVVDPHYKISSASGVEENSNDAQAAFLYAIETLCSKHGAAVMLAHHFAKGNASAKNAIDRAAGGGALARWPDVVMTLTEHEEEDCMTIEFSLRNFAPLKPFVARWAHPIWKRDDSLEPEKLKQPGGRREEHSAEKLLEALGDEPTSGAEWRRRAGLSESTFRRKRAALIESGKVNYASGLYTKKSGEEGEKSRSSERPNVSPKSAFKVQDYLPALAAKLKGREKRADANIVRRIASGVSGDTFPQTRFVPFLKSLLEEGIINRDPDDGRYYVP